MSFLMRNFLARAQLIDAFLQLAHGVSLSPVIFSLTLLGYHDMKYLPYTSDVYLFVVSFGQGRVSLQALTDLDIDRKA
jgi:hypothetical protein